ncbi:MAG TPA: S1 RNA-binding domain-containing protein [Anaerolineae bacterium]|nr:S1 RNA-binding domain-containing protein [Anaerolineae bacterium]
MGQMGEFVPGDAPLNEAYWEALLRDEGHGGTAPVTAQEPWGGESVDGSGTGEAAEPGHGEDAWKGARQAMEQGQVLQLPVVGCNRGGVLVGWNGLRGFVPASHLVDLSPSADEEERYDELRRLVGTRLCLKVIELDPALGRFVLSERASRFDESRRQDLLDRLCPGDICQGRVTNLCSFGAFVDLGGLEGLVHVSELSWGRVEHPGDLLQPSQPVEVYVLNVDRERRRVGLSIKRLQPDPWQSVEERYQVGQVVTGCITHIVNFGAFARVEDGLEGLIHISELAEGDFLHPRNVVREGDAVTARVINIDSERRRMGLSLRQVEESVQDDQKRKEGTGAPESLAGYLH